MSNLLGAVPHPEHDATCDVKYESVDSNSASASVIRRGFKMAAVVGLIVTVVGVAGDYAISHWIANVDTSHRVSVTSSMRSQAFQNKYQVPAAQRHESSCPNDGSVCICSGGYRVTGQNSYGYNEFAKASGSTACQAWKFRVGDIILVEKPAGTQKQYWQADVVARWTGSNVVHAAIVASVPPMGVNQNGKNIILVEALKGNIKKVVQNTLQVLVERYPFGGVHMRRVDPARYPAFFTPQVQKSVNHWLLKRVDEGFDLQMVNPLKRAVLARARYTPIDPWCSDRGRAISMYKDGGPGMWICSELVAWTLAFPGGLNMNASNKDHWCKYPNWVIKNLQPNPGDFLTTKWVQQIPWKMPCEELGCFIGEPPVGAPWVARVPHTPAPGVSLNSLTPQPTTTVAPPSSYSTPAPQDVHDYGPVSP